MKRIRAGDLDIAYLDLGPRDGMPVVLLHGFPYDVHCFDVASDHLARAGRRVLVPYLRGCGPTFFISPDAPRSGQQAALGADLLAFLDALNVGRAVLAGFDWGGRAACVVAALHPERVEGLVSCGTGYNIQDAAVALAAAAPDIEQRHWYWFYLASERGGLALTQDRVRLCRHLWRTFSPTWEFDDATFAGTAASFDNPDFVAVVRHSYRVRIGAAEGDRALGDAERRLSRKPAIQAPTIVLQGADDGVDPPDTSPMQVGLFTALRARSVLPGIGHNVPQEAPSAFATAVLALSGAVR